MKQMMSAEMTGKVLDGGIRAILAAVFSGAALYGGYAPFTVGAVAAAGNGWRGFCALCGAIAGALAFLDFSHALRTIAVCVLLFSANNAFYDLNIYQKPWFRAAIAAGLMVSVEFVYVLQAGSEEIAFCLICVLLAAAAAYSCEQTLKFEVKEEHPAAILFTLLGVLMAVSSMETDNGFAPGRIVSMLTVMLIAFERSYAQAITAALCIGLAVDTVGGKGAFVYAAAYAASALAMCLTHRGNRVSGVLGYLGGLLLFSLPLYAGRGMLLLYEGLAAALCFLLIPSRLLRGKRELNVKEGNLQRKRLKNSAAALRELYENISRTPQREEENPSIIYDRAAEKVCRSCSLCNSCWQQDYTRTHTALNDATNPLLQKGIAEGGDFPAYFANRCIRFPTLLEAINTELYEYLLRRSYHQRLGDAYRQAVGQYAQFSEILDSAAEKVLPASTAATNIPYQISVMMRPKKGERVSGDSASVFEAENKLCVILSDGMGSGEAAKKESQMAVQMLERFLRAGIDAAPALKTLNSALTLRAEKTDSFTTVDVLILSLQTGEAEVYKYGAAPSYIKRGGRVKRIRCTALPAGLQKDLPEITHFHLEHGAFLVMISDGTADETEDEWLQNLLAGWQGDNPQLLVSAILADSMEKNKGEDDAGVIVLYLPDSENALDEEV